MPEAFCLLQDDNVERMDWLWSNAMGGIKWVVRQEDAEESGKLLSEAPGDAAEEEDIAKDPQ